MPLSNVNILEATFKVIIEDEEESITDANNATSGAFSHISSSQRENSNAIFTSKKLEKLEYLVNAIYSLKINDAGYELSTATASGEQGDLTSNPDTVIHTSNGILYQKLLSCRTIVGFVSGDKT